LVRETFDGDSVLPRLDSDLDNSGDLRLTPRIEIDARYFGVGEGMKIIFVDHGQIERVPDGSTGHGISSTGSWLCCL